MQKYFRSIFIFIMLMLCTLSCITSASTKDGFTVRVDEEIRSFQQNTISILSPEEGSVSLLLSDKMGHEWGRPAVDYPVVSGVTTIAWDGLAAGGEPLDQGEYTLTATFVTSESVYSESTSVTVGRSRQALLYALPSGKTLYLDGGLEWMTEIRLLRPGLLCVAFYHAEDMENPIATSKKNIGNYKNLEYVWDGILSGERQEAGEYMLRFWAEENPDYTAEVFVTLVDGMYTAPALEASANYLPSANADDTEIWAAMQQPLVVSTLKSTSHQNIYEEPSKRSKSLGTIHGQSQGVQVIEVREDSWVKVGAFRHEDGSWVEGYVPADRLTILSTESEYGLLLDKKTQTITVFYQGERIGELLASTGLIKKNKLYQETPAGAYFTLEHMSNYSSNGYHYDYVIRYDGGNLLHQCGYQQRKKGHDYSVQEAILGQKASHGCIRIQAKGNAEGMNAYWIWTHIPRYTKVLVLDDPEVREAQIDALSGENASSEANTVAVAESFATPPPMEDGDTEITVTLGGDVVLGTREKWQTSEAGLPAYLEKYGMSYPFTYLQEIFSEDDITLVNLECVLKDDIEDMAKNKQYIFRGATSYTQVLLEAGIEQVNVANNHFIDYQESGKISTREALTAAGIYYSGYGDVYVWEYNGHKIGFAGCRETTYKEDASVILQDIEQLRAAGCEIILYSCHWGKEYSAVHNELQETMARTAAEAGADIIIGTHPHVVQGVAEVSGAPTLYSLGNLMFGGTHDMETFDGTLVSLRLRFDSIGCYQGVSVSFLPVLASSSGDLEINNFCPILATGEDKERILGKIQADSDLLLPDVLWFPAAAEN